jgi:prepilin-type N-terminal cleavage/methylation domain-containing protein
MNCPTPLRQMIHRRQRCRGFSLLELIVTVAMMATIVSGASLVLRSAQHVWAGHASDQARLDAAHATLRHLTRTVRQAVDVTAISSASDTSGALSVLLASGQTAVWDHSGTSVMFGAGSPNTLLASGINQLSFVGFEADGVTTTTVPADVQSINCTVTIALERTVNPTRAVSTRIWLRTW